MNNAALKGPISELEQKALLFIGMCALLAGMGMLTEHHDSGSLAPLLILVGLFSVCLGMVKRRRMDG